MKLLMGRGGTVRRAFLSIISLGLALAAPARAGLFGSAEYPRASQDAFGNWTAMMTRRSASDCAHVETASRPFADVAPGGVSPLRRSGACRPDKLDTAKLVAAAKRAPLLERLRRVNRAVNRVAYIEDEANYGAADYWATPEEFLARGGDCEDYAIAKYMLLKHAGVPAGSMRVVVVQDLSLGTSHALLSIKLDGTDYILDNQSPSVLPATEVARYRPVYSINETGWWLHMPA